MYIYIYNVHRLSFQKGFYALADNGIDSSHVALHDRAGLWYTSILFGATLTRKRHCRRRDLVCRQSGTRSMAPAGATQCQEPHHEFVSIGHVIKPRV